MTANQQLAKHFRDMHFTGSWTGVSLKDVLADVNWQQATAQVLNLNTIAVLVFHINYYVKPVMRVLKGGPLEASDKFSFGLTPISSEEDWQQLVQKTFEEAEDFATAIEEFDQSRLFDTFADEKYGTFYRNLLGIIEHTHYHLGQIALIKKMLKEPVVAPH